MYVDASQAWSAYVSTSVNKVQTGVYKKRVKCVVSSSSAEIYTVDNYPRMYFQGVDL